MNNKNGLEKQKKVFNLTTDSIEWAKWTWNPVTGCEHGCEYCYARDIANRFFEEGFEPTYHEDRLTAPANTKIPKAHQDDPGYHRVFVCSMADLFGEWVPDEWIEAVIEQVNSNPQWTFLFLTKNPSRYLKFNFPENAWLGATVDTQARVKETEKVFSKLEASVKFISCEPLLEVITFKTMPFDWLIIGGQSASSGGPASQPEWEWVENLLYQAREEGVYLYFKPNLTVVPKEYPG